MPTHKEQTLEQTPSLQSVTEEYGNYSLEEYGHNKYHGIVWNDDLFVYRKEEFLNILENFLKKFDNQIAQATLGSLRDNYCVSTWEHHGPLGHPFFFQSAILRGLVNTNNAVINLSTSHVSLGNSSYPRGIVFHGDVDDTSQYLHLPFFGAKDRMCPLYHFPSYTASNIRDYTLPKLESSINTNKISASLSSKIRNFLENIVLSEKLLQQEYFSDQCTILNYEWWKIIFGEDLPPFVAIDNEELIKTLLLWQIHHNHEYSRVFFTENFQEAIEQEFDTIGWCFDRTKKRGTYLFWHLDDQHRQHALWRKGGKLVSESNDFQIHINPKTIFEHLSTGALIPSWLLTYTLLSCYYKLTCFGGIFQTEYLTEMHQAYKKLPIIGTLSEVYPQTDIINADLYFLYSKSSPMTAMDMYLRGRDTPLLINSAKETSLKRALENSLADICSVGFHLLYPSWNLTALVEVKPANQAYKESIEKRVYENFPDVEQVWFIYTENNCPTLEMVGGEICVNATLCYFHLCTLRDKNLRQIFIKWPNCIVRWWQNIDGSNYIDFPQLNRNVLMYDPAKDAQIVKLPGITHIFTKNQDHTPAELAQPYIHEGGAIGVSHIHENKETTNLRTHIFLPHIWSFREETACGSAAIAYGALLTEKHGTISQKIEHVSGSYNHITWQLDYDGQIWLKLISKIDYRGEYKL